MQQKVYESSIESSIKKIITDLNVNSVLLVTGKRSFENSKAKPVIDNLASNIRLLRISDFDINPNFADVERIIKQLKTEGFDIFLSIGGGSVMDFAKLIKFYSEVSLNTPMDILGQQEITNKTPLIAVPTTSGSGSEATHFAVVYKGKQKYSVAHQKLLPNYVILDHELTESMPKSLTAHSGIDALSQALESLWAKNGTKESKSYAKEALELIVENLQGAVLSPNPSNRREMQKGAYLAGKAINISKTTAPHALAYFLTKSYGIPHGEAVGINLDLFLTDNWNFMNEADQTFLKNLFQLNNENEIADYLIGLKSAIGLKVGLKSIDELNLDDYISAINLERMKNNPKSYTQKELMQRLKKYHNL